MKFLKVMLVLFGTLILVLVCYFTNDTSRRSHPYEYRMKLVGTGKIVEIVTPDYLEVGEEVTLQNSPPRDYDPQG